MNLREGLNRRWKDARWRARNRIQAMLLERIDLEWKLASGIVVHVKSPTDWMIYNDIFVESEYDLPLQDAFSQSRKNQPVRVLDLGANVGFFSLRALHLHRLQKESKAVEVICVEGSPPNFRELQARVRIHGDQLQLVHGLAGEREGEGAIFQHPSHGMTRVAQSGLGNERKVAYVDLARLTEHWDSVDLVKCDIEGSEEIVLKNYPDLLRKTRRVVVELHHHLVNVSACRQMLRTAGLTQHRVLAERPYCSVEYFSAL